MKIFVAVIVIVLVLIVGWYFTYESIDQHTTTFVRQLDYISKTIEEHSWSIVDLEFHRLKDNWDKFRKVLSVILDHHEIDNIDLSMARTEQYIRTKNKPLSLAEIEVLKQLFLIVNESESLTLTNVF